MLIRRRYIPAVDCLHARFTLYISAVHTHKNTNKPIDKDEVDNKIYRLMFLVGHVSCFP